MIGRIRSVKWIGIIVIALWLSLSMAVMAEGEEVVIEVTSTEMEIGVSNNVTLILRNISNPEMVAFEGLENFEIVSTNQAQSNKNINGVSSKELSVTYTVMPEDVGEFQLKATIKSGKEIYDSNTVIVNVEQRSDDLDATKDIYVRTVVSDETIYFGEKTVVTYELYSMYQIDQYGFREDVEPDDFIIDKVAGAYDPQYLTIDGRQYVMHKAQQMVLTPTSTGVLTIPSYEFQANIGSSNVFSASQPKYLTTDPIEINVLSVPEVDKPEGYYGLVGDLQIESSYSDEQINKDDPLTLKIKVMGAGNLENLRSVVDTDEFKGFSVYGTEKDLVREVTSKGVKAYKTYEIILVPKTTGLLNIDPINIPYFDTKTQTYKNLLIPGGSVEVLGESGMDNGVAGTDQNDIRTQVLKINQVHYDDDSDAFFVIKLKKTTLGILGISILGVIVIVLVIYAIGLLRRKKAHSLIKYKKALGKATSIEEVYEVVVEMYIEVFEVNLRSVNTQALTNYIKDQEVLELSIELMTSLEHNKYYSDNPLEVSKNLTYRIIDKIM